jgi:glycosyltransferase involved in cell wall biosynthesis
MRYARALHEILASERVDAVLAYNPKCLAHAPIAARRAGIRHVVGMVTGLGHGFIGHGIRERLARLAKARLYRRAFDACDRILVQNDEDLVELERCGALRDTNRDRVRRIAGSGVDLERFSPEPLTAGLHFLMIARPIREKGVPEYFEAARQAHHQLPQATFAWMGPLEDPNPSSLGRATIEQLLASGVVRHLPERLDVRPALAACSVFVLPSHREGTSKVMLEAMATGRAVITTDAPGCGDAVGAVEFGAVVPVGNVRALADAMVRLGSDPDRLAELGHRARAAAETRFDARAVNAEILEALQLG